MSDNKIRFIHNVEDGWTIGYTVTENPDNTIDIAAVDARVRRDRHDRMVEPFSRAQGRRITSGRLACPRWKDRLTTLRRIQRPATGKEWRELEEQLGILINDRLPF